MEQPNKPLEWTGHPVTHIRIPRLLACHSGAALGGVKISGGSQHTTGRQSAVPAELLEGQDRRKPQRGGRLDQQSKLNNEYWSLRLITE